MVVVIVIGVLSTLMVPNLTGQRASAELRSAARGLHAAARHARDVASIRGATVRLLIAGDGGRTSYRLEVQDPEQPGAWQPMGSSLVPPTTLSPAVRIERMMIVPTRRDPSAEQAVCFYADGTADAAAVQMTNGVSTWTVLVEPNTARVELVDYAVDDAPNLRDDLDG